MKMVKIRSEMKRYNTNTKRKQVNTEQKEREILHHHAKVFDTLAALVLFC